MTITRTFAILALVAPLTVAAQVSYPSDSYYRYHSRTACDDRNDALWQRKSRLDADQRDIDREGAGLERMKAGLDDEFRHLDWANDAAISAYNTRSREYNRLIGEHNHRIARMNGAADVLNNDSQALVDRCGGGIVVSR